ncbi:sugar phosphate isomerase/epimerase family protein [Flexivirga meconopsidis]|uniref:sugar phosphate isomerase/epimerase family protein n=1 Tax=Flexivirga meconopsidis TaxID=2977121 RepID=UPI0022404489|nr:TIM barrel protein [Flexivirga meconopsidis]
MTTPTPPLGLCSVTFRGFSAKRVVQVAADAGLSSIEWGADRHAPPGDRAVIRQVRELTEAAGLRVASYGSYWRAGVTGLDAASELLDTARELGAPRVRVWAGDTGTTETSAEQRAHVVTELRRFAGLAAERGIVAGTEFHGGTLTDSADATVRLLEEVNHPNLQTYWQPPVAMPDEEALDGLRLLLARTGVCAVHVFSWWPETERLPLTDRAALWASALAELASVGVVPELLFEFVAGDDPAALVRDASALRALSAR